MNKTPNKGSEELLRNESYTDCVSSRTETFVLHTPAAVYELIYQPHSGDGFDYSLRTGKSNIFNIPVLKESKKAVIITC